MTQLSVCMWVCVRGPKHTQSIYVTFKDIKISQVPIDYAWNLLLWLKYIAYVMAMLCSLLNNITSNTCSINWNPKDLIDISFFVSFHCVSQLSAIEWQTHIQTTQKAQLFYKSTRSAHLFIVGLFHSKFCKGVLLVQVQFSTKILDCLVCLV